MANNQGDVLNKQNVKLITLEVQSWALAVF